MLPHLKLKKSQLISKLQLAGKKIQPVLLGLQQALPQALIANQMVAISLMKAVTSMLKDFQHILVRTVKV